MNIPDRRKTIEIVLVAIGIAYLLYRMFAPKIDAGRSAAAVNAATGNIPIEAEAVISNEPAGEAAQVEGDTGVDIESARDIFQMPDKPYVSDAKAGAGAASGMKDAALTLEGVILAPGKNITILSSEVVAEGDMIRGAKVIRIEHDKVILLKNGVESEIKRGA